MQKAIGLVLPAVTVLLLMMGLLWISALREGRMNEQEALRLSERVAWLEAELAAVPPAGREAASGAAAVLPQLAARDLVPVTAPVPAASEAGETAEPAGESEVVAVPEAVEAGAPGQVLAPTNSPMPRPYRVRAYLGGRYLGLAWAVPSNLRRDAETGRVTYEPVIRLPETAREAFKEYVTNVVEVAAAGGGQVYEREVYVEHRPYWVGLPYPVVVPGRGHRPHPGQPPQVPPARPQPEAPPLVRPPQERGDPGLYVPPFNR